MSWRICVGCDQHGIREPCPDMQRTKCHTMRQAGRIRWDKSVIIVQNMALEIRLWHYFAKGAHLFVVPPAHSNVPCFAQVGVAVHTRVQGVGDSNNEAV